MSGHSDLQYYLVRSGLVIGLVVVLGMSAMAQSSTAKLSPTVQPKVSSSHESRDLDTDSIISPDDVLDIYVVDVPELSRQYRVSPSGTVVFPLLAEPLHASGMTLTQFSDALSAQLRSDGFVTNPHMVVTIVNSRLKSVAITGSVKMPQIYPVFGTTTLLDVLSQSQGLTDDASNLAVISRGKLGFSTTGETTLTVDLKNLLQSGDAKYNVEIYPGDRVTVPRAGVVYVVGAVNKPGGFVIKSADNGMTVLQALAMAEDTKSTAMRNKTVIIRPDPNAPGGHSQISLDLNMVLAAKEPDPLLHPDDVLFVPDSTAKKAFRRGLEAALQMATGLAIYGRY